ncbi:molecular chaperone [Herbaspirillum sp. AP02]|uniref:fimbrial biogenesis chaperone n=1 Tax=unclassified Herbaspirillum TaxID=2624150 RepID=UPI0015DA21A7|nr:MULTISPECIES: molecular chaperone [unclassified Herbaspirillum]MBG7621464.1 molecular chaperone [Herbaspirillum sp. AP02]NZD67013.1 molecular chaperone [Herbaspirillum sp. AP21]
MRRFSVFLWLALAVCARVEAGVMPERTRLVFSQGVGEISLRLANTNDYPVMVQSWVDQGEGSQAPDTVLSSMFVMPAVLRLQPRAISQVRVLYTGDPLPGGRESVFWLNLYEIALLPATAPQQDASRLLLGLNTQMKVFYRPPGLPDPGPQWQDALHFQLRWDERQWVLVCHNDSPYFVSFASLQLSDGTQEFSPRLAPDQMVPPFGEQRYLLQAETAGAGMPSVWHAPRLRYQMIDDDGRVSDHDIALKSPPLP